jgi:DNA-directed RNA polymerase specialized sigma24 family protein
VLQSEPDARDAAQQVFMRLWESRGWSRIDDPRAFFTRAGRNEALAVLRRRRRRRSILATEAVHARPGQGPSPEEALLRSEQRDQLLRLIAMADSGRFDMSAFVDGGVGRFARV